jgi:hypothetical protein
VKQYDYKTLLNEAPKFMNPDNIEKEYINWEYIIRLYRDGKCLGKYDIRSLAKFLDVEPSMVQTALLEGFTIDGYELKEQRFKIGSKSI